jgi:hypothetical protein
MDLNQDDVVVLKFLESVVDFSGVLARKEYLLVIIIIFFYCYRGSISLQKQCHIPGRNNDCGHGGQ